MDWETDSAGMSAGMAHWLAALSVTPRFDQETALALDQARGFGMGEYGWNELVRLPYVEDAGGGFFRLSRALRRTLSPGLTHQERTDLHRWFASNVKARALWFYHRWKRDPVGAAADWAALMIAARDERRGLMEDELLSWVSEIRLDKRARRLLGDDLWASVHLDLGRRMTSASEDAGSDDFRAGLAHLNSALQVYTRAEHPLDWARVQVSLGDACVKPLARQRGARKITTILRMVRCYEGALDVLEWHDFDEELDFERARIQVVLGMIHQRLAAEDDDVQLFKAIELFRKALPIMTKDDDPETWAMVQNSLGKALTDLQMGNRVDNLVLAIESFTGYLTVFPDDSTVPDILAGIERELVTREGRPASQIPLHAEDPLPT